MQRLRTAFLLAAAGIYLVSLAARAPLIDPDEGLHAAIAQEMLLRHDFVTPAFLGEPFLDKPIFFFWAEAASLKLFGMNETAVRIPPLLFGFLGACSVALLGAAMFGGRTGWSAGIVYATMILPVGVSEVAVHDIALVPCIALACYGIWRIANGRPLLPSAALVGASLGVSILTKGLAGAAIAGLFGLAVVVFDRRALPRLALAAVIASAIAALVAAPWYIAMERAHAGYLHYYFVERHVEGYLTSTQRHAGRDWWYYIPVVAGGALPWLPFASAGGGSARRARAIVFVWFFASFVFLSAGESKLATYALPVFPALAIVIGDTLAASTTRSIRFRTVFVLFALACALLPFVAVTAVATRFPVHAHPLQVVSGIAGLLIALIALRAWQSDGVPRLEWMTSGAFISLAAVLLLAVPSAARWMTGKDLAAILNSRASLPPRVFVLDERIGSVVFYLSPALRREATPDRFVDATLAAVFQRLPAEPADALLAVRTDQLPRLQRLLRQTPVPDAESGTYSVFSVDTLRRTIK
jgi:4-amino-4-deoxy-L-arabinose transferase-like glycosyltransferase